MDANDWIEARLPSDVVHLDAAACGRQSQSVLDAQIAHVRREAAAGGYVAEAEAEAGPLAQLRKDLTDLVGLPGGEVAFAEAGGAAFAALMSAWPLGRSARVGTVTSEFGPHAAALRYLAQVKGWELVHLPVDRLGRITDVPEGLDVIAFPHVASQRGIVQPVDQVLRAGVPVVLDVAQSLGQAAIPAGCAAYVGTSRKWLCGPRGVGFAVVDPAIPLLDPLLPSSHGLPGVRRIESGEAHVAGRVGLAQAVAEWTPELLPLIAERAKELRQAADGVGGWRVVEPVDEPTGLTTLRPPGGGDAPTLRAALLEQGVLVSAIPLIRAEDVDVPLLRVSTPAWTTSADVEAFREALARSAPV